MNDRRSSEEGQLAGNVYRQHREFLLRGLYEQAKSFDKGILTLASGALALSLVFIQRIAPDPKPWTLYFLLQSWLCFAASIVSTLMSFLASQAAHRNRIREWDESYDAFPGKPNIVERKIAGALTHWLNIASASLFLAGVVSLIVFAVGNVPTDSN